MKLNNKMTREQLIKIAADMHGVDGTPSKKLFEKMPRKELEEIVKACQKQMGYEQE